MFTHGELSRIMSGALRETLDGLDTKELTAIAMRAKGFDLEDGVLVSAIRYRVGVAMQRYRAKGRVLLGEMRSGVRKWRVMVNGAK